MGTVGSSESFTGIKKTTDSFDFEFFDGFVPRILEVQPRKVPTNVVMNGRKLYLRSRVSVTISNFPQSHSGVESVVVVLKQIEHSKVLRPNS